MPNWCNNSIQFSSKNKAELLRLKKRVYEKDYYKGEVGKERDCIFSFNKITPYPKAYKQIDKLSKMRGKRRDKEAIKRGYKNFNDMPDSEERDKLDKRYPEVTNSFNLWGWGWCCENWGTKWNAKHIEDNNIKKLNNNLYAWDIFFDTAWSPPIHIFETIRKQYPKIDIDVYYEEEGVGFKGEYITKNGKVIFHKSL